MRRMSSRLSCWARTFRSVPGAVSAICSWRFTGSPTSTTAFLASIGPVTGVDVDPEVHTNTSCTRTLIYDGEHIPLEDETFDAAVCNYVCEHIQKPIVLCREIRRVLREGGVFALRTPNLWHYVSVASRFTPHRLHRLVANRARGLPAGSHEPWPTFYRMNTRRACRKILEQAGFAVLYNHCIEPEPSYAMAARAVFYPAMLWERLLNSTFLLEDLRANILCVAAAVAADQT
uniref:SAM-dependent methyltransferase n=1 Tax=Desulfobacca acetoxidans TaxID=60893 RepID=A0A7V4LDN2_9BACT